MSSFMVAGRRIDVLAHDNADALEIARVRGTEFVSVVRKGEFTSGDVIVYIPEQAVVPQPILERMNLWGAERKGRVIGRLAGPDGNRVKAARLRGVISQGLVYRPDDLSIEEGVDYAEQLGIIKWVPPIPADMAGQVEPHEDIRTYTDLENIKYFPDVLQPGEEIVATEKLHGTCSLMSLIDGAFLVSSKGRAGKGLVILRDETPDGRTKNAYWRNAERIDAPRLLADVARRRAAREVTLFGETLGVQDLRYGLPGGELDFRAFDLRVDGQFLDFDEFLVEMRLLGLPICPVLYRGPYDRAEVDRVTSGSETLTGTASHLREGVVVRPVRERYDDTLGRVILKSISPDYLTRKGETTEYE